MYGLGVVVAILAEIAWGIQVSMKAWGPGRYQENFRSIGYRISWIGFSPSPLTPWYAANAWWCRPLKVAFWLGLTVLCSATSWFAVFALIARIVQPAIAHAPPEQLKYFGWRVMQYKLGTIGMIEELSTLSKLDDCAKLNLALEVNEALESLGDKQIDEVYIDSLRMIAQHSREKIVA